MKKLHRARCLQCGSNLPAPGVVCAFCFHARRDPNNQPSPLKVRQMTPAEKEAIGRAKAT